MQRRLVNILSVISLSQKVNPGAVPLLIPRRDYCFMCYAMPRNLRCSCQLSGNPYSTLVRVSVPGALSLITAVIISGARLTSDSVRATWERSDLRCSASSNTVEKVSQILLYLPHNFSNLLRQFFFIILRIMTDKIDLDIFEFFSQFLFNFCCIKQLLGWIAHNYNDQWQL